MNKDVKVLFKTIESILRIDWDPIGINNNENIRDEYKAYVPFILKLKLEGSDFHRITKHLYELETNLMGMPGNINRCAKIALKLIDL